MFLVTHSRPRSLPLISMASKEAVPPVKEYDKSKLLIKDIPKEVDEDYFCMSVECCLGLDHETDFTYDLRSGVAVLFFGSSYTDEGIFNIIR